MTQLSEHIAALIRDGKPGGADSARASPDLSRIAQARRDVADRAQHFLNDSALAPALRMTAGERVYSILVDRKPKSTFAEGPVKRLRRFAGREPHAFTRNLQLNPGSR
jgi:hypothetical protein